MKRHYGVIAKKGIAIGFSTLVKFIIALIVLVVLVFLAVNAGTDGANTLTSLGEIF